MKKLFLTILIVLLLIATLAPFGVSVFADTNSIASDQKSYQPHANGYTLHSMVDADGNPAGVSFSKSYFGASGIAVSIQLYSDPNGFDLSFWIGAKKLSADQLATRQQLVEFFDFVDQTANVVDAVANTQYNGQNGLPTSDIYRYNQATQGAKLQIDYHTYKMLSIGREMYDITNHAFNPAIYRLVDLWGFSSRIYSQGNFGLPYDREVTFAEWAANGYPLPDQKYVDAFSNPAFTDFSQNSVTLTEENGNYYVTKNVAPVVVDGVSFDQWLDLGGIAKGYVVDLVKQKLSSLGQTRFFVDAGSSSQTYGYNSKGENIKMAINDPFSEYASLFPTSLVGFGIANRSVSTSGQYVRKYTTNGIEYAHIIDGKRGAPAQTGINSITITIPDDDGSNYWACKADCLSTAMTVLGRDGIVDFCNTSFFAQNNIEVLVFHKALDGGKQVLSNMDQNALEPLSESWSNFSWNLKNVDGHWTYDGNAQLIQLPKTDYTWLLVVLAVVVVALFAVVVVARYTTHKQKQSQNIPFVKKDKFFKPADVMVYLVLVMVILVLFSVFFGENEQAFQNIKTVSVVDMQTNQVLLIYDVIRNEYQVAEDCPWNIKVVQTADGVVITLDAEINGEHRFNEITITTGTQPTAKMTNSVCGFHQDCVRNFGTMTTAGQSIVCSPNYLKVVTD